MKRAITGFALLAALAVPTAAHAGTQQLPDYENDYEGTVEQNDEAYFGFDLNKNKSKASGFTTRLSYNCPTAPDGGGLSEVEGSLKVKDKKFDGVLEQKFSGQARARGNEPPKNVTFVFDIEDGKLGSGGKASGKIAAKAVLKFQGGEKETCKATDDGKWKAEKGADVGPPLRSR